MTAGSSAGGAADHDRSVAVVEAIRDAIADGEFTADQRLIEADLSERLNASRGSVRAALMQLSTEGLVERLPNRGARVRAVSLAEAIEITEVRMELEALCAVKAARRLTGDECTQLRAIGGAMQETNVRHQLRVAMQPGRPAVSLPQHLEIIDALCARNAKAAETAVRRHIRGLIRARAGTSVSSSRRRATSSFDGSETSSP